MANKSGLGVVDVKHFSTRNFSLQSGEVLPELKLVYETYGTLAPDRHNAILVTHGYTSSQHAAGLDANGEPGWWDGLIGPGKAIDTDKYFVVSSNMLGSSYGSTAPASINPKTGKPYGPDFPDYSLADIVTAQRAMLDAIGVTHLVAVAGLSFGGYQAFQWGVTFPDAMRGIVAVVTAPGATDGARMVADLRARFAEAPGWNGGHHYGNAEMIAFMTELRVATLKRYGIEAQLAPSFPDPAKRVAMIPGSADTHVHQVNDVPMIKYDVDRARAGQLGFSQLDVATGLVLRSLIQELAARGKVVLFSSHELETVERVCSHVVILHRGKVVADDSIQSLRTLMSLPTLEDIFSQLAVEQDTAAVSRQIADLILA